MWRLSATSNLVSVRERVAQALELHRHVHRLHGDIGRRLELRRREVENGLDTRLHHTVEHRLRIFCGNTEPGAVGTVLAHVTLELRDVAHGNTLEAPADLLRIRVVRGKDEEPALPKAPILRERRADFSRADDDHLPLAAESENLAQSSRELRHRVTQPAFSE